VLQAPDSFILQRGKPVCLPAVYEYLLLPYLYIRRLLFVYYYNYITGGINMPVPKIELDELVRRAQEVRKNSYSPYSGFAVGAALLAESGAVYTGTNCESASYGGTICAERAALTAAVSAGERKFEALAVAAGDRPVTPCGICRQLLAEFGDMTVLCAAGEGAEYKTTSLSALLPDAFVTF
jgi:cytidine deaminase